MCQCGCGETNIEKAVELPNGYVVGWQVYHGCDTCFAGPALSISFFPDNRSEWIDRAKIESLVPTQDGGNQGNGISFGLFEVQDLKAEAAELINGADIGPSDDDYASLVDWLEDYGLELIQGAMRRFNARIR